MLRFLGYLLLIFVPFAVYAVYVAIARTGAFEPGRSTPWIKLTVAGLALAFAGLVATALLSGSDPGSTYVPARLEGGRILPPEMR